MRLLRDEIPKLRCELDRLEQRFQNDSALSEDGYMTQREAILVFLVKKVAQLDILVAVLNSPNLAFRPVPARQPVRFAPVRRALAAVG